MMDSKPEIKPETLIYVLNQRHRLAIRPEDCEFPQHVRQMLIDIDTYGDDIFASISMLRTRRRKQSVPIRSKRFMR